MAAAFFCRLFRSTEQQNSHPRPQRAALRWAKVWNRRRKQAQTPWGADAGDVPPSPFGALMVEGPALGWTGRARLQSAELDKFGQGSWHKRCFCLFLSGWVRDGAQHPGHPADKALPTSQGPCAEEFVLRAEPGTEGEHSNWTKSFGHHLIFSQGMFTLPQSLTALTLSHATRTTFPYHFCGSICMSEATFANYNPGSALLQQPWEGCTKLWAQCPFVRALCPHSQLVPSTATSGSSCKSSSHLMWNAVGWELYNLSI